VLLVSVDKKLPKVRNEIIICRQQACTRSDWIKYIDFLISLSWTP
jgi:hypothetical protein